MKKIIIFVLMGLFLGLLTGCITADYCRIVNTYEQGYLDALDGKPTQSFDKTVRSCAEHKVKLNLKEYNKGWKAGFKVFCSYKKGYKLGLEREEYHGMCSSSEEFLKGYKKGDKRCLYEFGYFHATKGKPSSFSSIKCLKLSKEQSKKEYMKGRIAGMKVFCTYQGGYKFGSEGGEYQNICSKKLEADFIKGYTSGLQKYAEAVKEEAEEAREEAEEEARRAREEAEEAREEARRAREEAEEAKGGLLGL